MVNDDLVVLENVCEIGNICVLSMGPSHRCFTRASQQDRDAIACGCGGKEGRGAWRDTEREKKSE